MGFPTKVQLIQRKDSQQWYINFPSAVAQAMEFQRGEIVEWIVEDKNRLLLRRRKVSTATLKKPNATRPDGLLECAVRSGARSFRAAALRRAGPRAGSVRPDLFGPPHLVRLAVYRGTTD
jgi:hypothetical protein